MLGDLIPASWHAVKSVHTHPGFFAPANGGESSKTHDMGLLVLESPAAGAPACLPAGDVFSKPKNGALNKKTYTLVGYGSHIDTSPPAILPGGTRQVGFPRYYNVVDSFIWMQQNPNAGRSGGCFAHAPKWATCSQMPFRTDAASSSPYPVSECTTRRRWRSPSWICRPKSIESYCRAYRLGGLPPGI